MLDELGLSLTSATTAFPKAVVRCNGMPFDVTACPRYGCEAAAPELVLAKLPYSPDAALLQEQRARLAAIVHAADLSDEELALVAQYVRGD